MKTFNSDLVLEKDTIFNESIMVHGNISCKNGMRYYLKVRGNIDARNINALDIDSYNIDALDIDSYNINADNIDAHNINAYNIDARNIDALNIDAHNINAYNINSYNIDAHDINLYNIDALNIIVHNIDALNIKAHDINALNIDALDINAYYIICETRRKKTPNSKTFCKVFVQDKSKLERKYHEVEGKKNDNMMSALRVNTESQLAKVRELEWKASRYDMLCDRYLNQNQKHFDELCGLYFDEEAKYEGKK